MLSHIELISNLATNFQLNHTSGLGEIAQTRFKTPNQQRGKTVSKSGEQDNEA
jgi:hypothetical protein